MQGNPGGAGGGPLTIVAFGDSLTAGYGLPADKAYPALVQAMLRADGFDVRIVNAGVSGDTTTGGLARLSWALADLPDIVILELGANDGLRGLDPGMIEANLDAILKRLADRRITTLLAGMRMPANLGQGYVRAYDAIFPKLAEKYGVEFYPYFLDGVSGNSSLNLADGLHPNEQGAAVIAKNIYPAVRRVVEARLRQPGK